MIFTWIQSFVGVLRRACIGTNWCTWVGRVAPRDPCVVGAHTITTVRFIYR